MRHEFVSEQPAPIAPERPNVIQSKIAVTDLEGAKIEAVEVGLDITLIWRGDLRISVRSPDGTDVLLLSQEGGFQDDIRNTIFRDTAQTPIAAGRPPFRGIFRPEQELARSLSDLTSLVIVTI